VRTLTKLSAGAVALALVCGAASGQDRRPPPDASLGKKKSVAPDASLAGSLESAKGAKAEAGGPALGYETFRYQVEVAVSGKRREEIADLRKLISLGGAPAEMPTWLFRLAELYWEESQHYFFEANRRDDELLALPRPAPAAEVARLTAAKKDLEARSRAHQDEAIAQYKEIVQRYPRYARMDEVLFFLGENLWRQGQQKEALAAYKLLVTQHQKSRYVPDAWMAFGEHYFNSAEHGDRRQSLQNSLKAYQRAASYTESTVYGYALYKQAWVYYNLAQWNEALDLFRAVVLFGELPTTTLASDKRLALVREARKDYVRTYSHVGAPETAIADFKKLGGESGWWDMAKGLAELYYQEGKDRDASLVYHQLIQERPLTAEAPLFQARIVTCAGRLGRKDLAVQQARLFLRILKEVEDSGTVVDEKGKKQLEEARVAAENTLRTLAVLYHTEWKKTRDDPVALLAAEVYQDYLQVFPSSPQAYGMRFFFAELLFALERYQRAGEEYSRVALADAKLVDAGQKPGKHMQDALEFSVHAYDLVAKKFEETEKRAAADPKTPLPIPAPKQDLLDVSLRYRKYAPKGEKYVEVTYRAANIYYRYNHLGEAASFFTEIALAHPGHELAGYAANLALDTYNLQGDWKSMSGWAKRFYASAELSRAHPGLQEDLARVIEQSAFKVIEEDEKAHRYPQAAEAYLAFAHDWPKSRLAPAALYNASLDLAQAQKLDRAARVREDLVALYPGDAVVPKVLWSNGADSEAVADFEKAASFYERYYEGFARERQAARPQRPARRGRSAPPPPSPSAGIYEEAKARDALYNAGVFREGLRQLERAEADRRAWVESWPEAPEAGKVFLSLADIYAKENAPAKELKLLEEYQRRYAQDPTEWIAIEGRIARALEKSGNAGGARRAWAQALEHQAKHRSQVGERALPVVAWASYLELEGDFERYDRITLDVKPRYLKAQLEVKAKKLAELQRLYTEVVNLKQAEAAVCALTRIGEGYRRFARALQGAPVPAELRALKRQDVVEEYKAQLAQLAEAPQKKAAEGFEYALAKAREYGMWNDCSRQAGEALARLDPDRHAPPLETVPPLVAPAPPPAAGHGLLLSIRPPQASPPEGVAEALPPLRGDPARAPAEPARDAARPPSAPKPTRAAQAASARAAPSGDPKEDEDLLP